MNLQTEYVPTHRDVVYVRRGERELCLDLYLPAGGGPWPAVTWFHGGGWHEGDKGSPYTAFLVDHGFAVADVAYRLTTEAPAPANLHDCQAAVRWLRREADAWGIDASRIGLSGGSAGGHLALLAAAPVAHPVWRDPDFPDEPPPCVQAVAALAAPTDLTWSAAIDAHPRRTDYLLMLERLLGRPLRRDDELARLFSPMSHAGLALPPTLIVHGDADETIDIEQGRRYVAALRAAGAAVTYHEEPGGGHRRDTWRWPIVAETILAFFQRTLGR